MSETASGWQSKLIAASNRFARVPVINIIRQATMAIIPLAIIGAVGVFFANVPFPGLAALLEPVVPFASALNNVTMGASGLAVAMTIGYFAARQYGVDPVFATVSSTVVFLSTQLNEDLTLGTDNFGASGIFTAMITGLTTVYIIHLCKRYRVEIRMPSGVPPMVAESFSIIIPLALSLTLFLGLSLGLGLNVNTLIQTAFSPLANGLSTLPGVIVYFILASLFWWCGIQPSVILGFLIPVLAISAENNAAAVAAGVDPSSMPTWGTYGFFALGGTGVTIGLALLLLFFAKSKTQKALGRVAFIPALFNINEPMIFGVPIIFNPVMLVPMIVAPVFAVTSTWLLMTTGVIGYAYLDIPWSTPVGINGFLASGGDWRTALWSVLLALISALIYYPFFKVVDRMAASNEAKAEEAAPHAAGSIAGTPGGGETSDQKKQKTEKRSER